MPVLQDLIGEHLSVVRGFAVREERTCQDFRNILMFGNYPAVTVLIHPAQSPACISAWASKSGASPLALGRVSL